MDKKKGREIRRAGLQRVRGQVRKNEQVLVKKKLESAQRIMKEVEDDSIRIDQLPLCNLYFRAPLKNATGCDLFNSSGYKQTERFHLRLGCPTKVPKERTGTHTHKQQQH